MERQDLLEANGAIFTVQGRALNDHAADDLRVLVVGNPANTNCLIAMNSAPDVPRRALHRHDAPGPQPGHHPGGPEGSVPRRRRVADDDLGQPLGHPVPGPVSLRGRRPAAAEVIDDQAWLEGEFIPTVQQRGAAIIEARGASSAASAANAAIDHVHDWVLGTADGDWVSMGVPSDGSYGVPEGLLCGFPATCADGRWSDRAGSGTRRVLPCPDRRIGRRTGLRARHGAGPGPDLGIAGLSTVGEHVAEAVQHGPSGPPARGGRRDTSTIPVDHRTERVQGPVGHGRAQWPAPAVEADASGSLRRDRHPPGPSPSATVQPHMPGASVDHPVLQDQGHVGGGRPVRPTWVDAAASMRLYPGIGERLGHRSGSLGPGPGPAPPGQWGGATVRAATAWCGYVRAVAGYGPGPEGG